MVRCRQRDCGWVAIAPSERAAWKQYEAHVLREHVEAVETDVPDGCVQIRTDDGEWKTMSPEEALEFDDD
ncbi:hypothetical protein [Haladaptatus salinisoli]|uniref:hypothetical protein n=1 Tax=Haladaptatus salinisoli TaxID=2884876 RepID=UPI001D09E5AC|nr:hypothetical protein [Haladaptatus salinisoli]